MAPDFSQAPPDFLLRRMAAMRRRFQLRCQRMLILRAAMMPAPPLMMFFAL